MADECKKIRSSNHLASLSKAAHSVRRRIVQIQVKTNVNFYTFLLYGLISCALVSHYESSVYLLPCGLLVLYIFF
jgi:hypothetical protein